MKNVIKIKLAKVITNLGTNIKIWSIWTGWSRLGKVKNEHTRA